MTRRILVDREAIETDTVIVREKKTLDPSRRDSRRDHFDSSRDANVAVLARRDQTKTNRREETRDTETANLRRHEATPGVTDWRNFSPSECATRRRAERRMSSDS